MVKLGLLQSYRENPELKTVKRTSRTSIIRFIMVEGWCTKWCMHSRTWLAWRKLLPSEVLRVPPVLVDRGLSFRGLASLTLRVMVLEITPLPLPTTPDCFPCGV